MIDFNPISYEQQGWSDEEILQKLYSLKRVMFQVVKVKKKEGRKVVYVDRYKWKGGDNESIRKKILQNIKRYEDKVQKLSEEDNRES